MADDVKGRHRDLTKRIIGCAIEVHRALGPGLLEKAYETCVAWELTEAGLAYKQQVELPISYKGLRLSTGFRVDLVVEDTVIVELKCMQSVLPIHEAQLLTYLRLAEKPIGLLINFNEGKLVDGIIRRVI